MTLQYNPHDGNTGTHNERQLYLEHERRNHRALFGENAYYMWQLLRESGNSGIIQAYRLGMLRDDYAMIAACRWYLLVQYQIPLGVLNVVDTYIMEWIAAYQARRTALNARDWPTYYSLSNKLSHLDDNALRTLREHFFGRRKAH